MRTAVVLACLVTACSVQERKPKVVDDRDPAAAIARVRKIPGLGERLRPDAALVPATLGVKLDKAAKDDLEVILPLTARGPLRIQRDEGRVLDVTAEHAADAKGLIDSGAMVFVAPSPEVDSVMIAERARFTELRVLRGPATTKARWRLRLGDGLIGAREGSDFVELVTPSGLAWLRTDKVVLVDASGWTLTLPPHLEGTGREVTLVVPLDRADPSHIRFPAAIVVTWTEGAQIAPR